MERSTSRLRPRGRSELKSVRKQAMDAGGGQVPVMFVTIAYERAVAQKLP